MFRLIRRDLVHKARWYGREPTPGSLIRMLFSDGTTAQVLYRAMQFCQKHHMKPVAAIVYRLNAAISHAVIGRGADIGPGFVILHSIGVVINTHVRAGENLVIAHGVTIGEHKGRNPVLGDNVFIGCHATVIGGVRIGDNVRVGANSLVNRDIPDGATAVGVPAEIVRIAGREPADNESGAGNAPDRVEECAGDD